MVWGDRRRHPRATRLRGIYREVRRHASVCRAISAEHGIGLMKKKYLSYSRSPEEIAYLKAIKTAFDPKNVMNPGKIFDL